MSEPTHSLRTTALHAVHEALGAKMVDFAGWSMPVWYGGATDEHHAVRQRAGLFDLGHMGELFVAGPGAAAALDWALLVDASAMPIGRARYSMLCNERGGIIDDLIVYRLADDRFMVVANASNAVVVHHELVARTNAGGFDASVTDSTDDWALIALQGPSSAAVLADLVDIDLSTIRYYRIDAAPVAGFDAMIARTGYTGEDGFELFVNQSDAVSLWQAIAEAGGDMVTPCGLACRDTLRLEAGMPLYGNELSVDTTPHDVGASRLVRTDGPDHVGRTALLAAGERPARHLVGLHVEGRRPARAGYTVTDRGEPIGAITSGALSPTLDRPIAIASVATALTAGHVVDIDVRGKPVAATVVELPFYIRP